MRLRSFVQPRPIATLIILGLTACAPPQERVRPGDPEAEQPAVPDNPQVALERAETLAPEKRRVRLLAWADDYLDQGRTDNVGRLLEAMDPEQLPDQARLQWAHLRARVLLARQDSDAALAVLNDEDLQIPALIGAAEPARRNRLRLLRADALMLDGQLLPSLRERVAMQSRLKDENDQAYNREMTWSLLMDLPMGQLKQLTDDDTEPVVRGWAELARLFRDPLTDINTQNRQLQNWQERWQGHPAERHTPDMVAALTRAAGEGPETVAIILPLSGPLASAGKVIRNGLLTGYYSALAQGRSVPELRFYDNGDGKVIEHYNAALGDNADLVLGPLSKKQVDQVARIDRLPVTTLTLNYTDNKQPPDNLYQFGLDPEHEARQVVEQAYAEGARLAGVLYPDSDWGKRMARTYIQAFEENGGLITTQKKFGNNETEAVGQMLAIGQSHQRARRLNRLTDQHLQFKPRRRQDLDVLFLAASDRQARQVKPALNFHYARNLPVFATSHIYAGSPDPKRDRDLDNIRFVDLPWLLDRDSELHERANRTWPQGHGSRERLFALGVDAWRLQARLKMLESVPDSQLPGVTGRLRVGQDRHIVRRLDWAFFDEGKPRRLPVVSGRGRMTGSDEGADDLITRPQGQPE